MGPLKPLLLCLVLAALGLLLLTTSGCQSTSAPGTAPPTALQTFDALYANALSADTLAVTATTAALQSGFINATQAKQVLAITDSVKTLLDAANQAAQAGSTGSATANLAAALGPIAMVSACLTSKPLTPATFTSCMAKLQMPQVAS